MVILREEIVFGESVLIETGGSIQRKVSRRKLSVLWMSGNRLCPNAVMTHLIWFESIGDILTLVTA